MRSACLIAALAGLAYAAPKPAPQDMNFDEIDVSFCLLEVPNVLLISKPVC